jgi:uncharacterized protein
MPAAFILIGVLPVLTLPLLGIYFARQLIDCRRYSTRHTIDDGLDKGEFTQAFVDMPKEDFLIRSPFGYDLSGFAIPGSPERTVIFCHGVSWTLWGMAKYMDSFLDRGWNIVAYDHRAHGDSGGRRPGYGYYEKYDLKAVEDWTMSRFSQTRHLGLFGESMGAATVLQFAPMSRHATFLVLESPYSDLMDLCRTRLAWAGVPGLLITPLILVADLYIRAAAGFSLRDVSPRMDLACTNLPAIFFHGKEDEQIPAAMSIGLHNAHRDRAQSRLALFDGAMHSRSIIVEKRRYLSELWSFLSELVPEEGLQEKRTPA